MNWVRSETTSGIPYFINHRTERTQWDHPRLVKAWTNIRLMDNICYVAYRTAMKLRHFQKILNCHLVDLTSITSAIDHHMGSLSKQDYIVDAFQLRDIIYEIFLMTRSGGRSKLNVSDCTDLLLNWILNIYDSGRTGFVSVRSFQAAAIALCSGRILAKYKYLFQIFSPDGGYISRQGLEKLCEALMQITDLLGETQNFGVSGVQATVESCLSNLFMGSVSQKDFISWMLSEPQTLVWLPTLHRLSAAETVKHEAKCNVCKCHPMVGFRYQCLKCLNFDICQQCFFTRRSSKRHHYTHPIQEYCLSASPKDGVRALAKTVRNKISKKHGRRIKQKYLTIEDDKNGLGFRTGANSDDHLATHIRLGKLSKQLAAVEEDPSLKTKLEGLQENVPLYEGQTDSEAGMQDKTKDRKKLEDLVDALERENEDLATELENYYHNLQRRQKEPSRPRSSSLSSDESKQDEEERKVHQEILEEHNNKLEVELNHYKRLIKEKERLLMQRARMEVVPGFLDKTAPPRLEPYGQSEQQLNKIDGHVPLVSDVSDQVPSIPTIFFKTPSIHHPFKDTSPGKRTDLSKLSNTSIPVGTNEGLSQPREIPISNKLSPGGLFSKQELSTDSPDVGQSNSRRIMGTSLPAQELHATQGMTASRVWPPHLIDESTVRFPNMSVTRVYPSDEAELDEMVGKMTAALDRSATRDGASGDPASETLDAFDQLGEAMQHLVSEINAATITSY